MYFFRLSTVIYDIMVSFVIRLIITGFPEVGVTPLIAHISLMPGPIIKPFDSMKVKDS